MEAREITEENFIECMALDFPNFKITKSNLTHPTSHFIISFYSLILRHAIELNEPEEIWNLTENQRSYMNLYHPETATFGQHAWAHNLHAAVKYVFGQLSQNGTEFAYSDILFPENTPRRSFVFMALMLNFYWYSNDFAVDLNSDMTACLEEVRAIQDLKSDKERLMSQLKVCEDQRSQYIESFRDIKKYIMKCTESNEEKEQDIKELMAREEAVLQDLKKVEEKEQKLQEDLTKHQNEKNYLESLIVSNQNQVIDIHQKHIIKKEECVKKMKALEQKVKIASSTLVRSNQVLELQQKLNFFLKEEKSSTEGKQKGFESLFDTINSLQEKKKKLSEEESSLSAEFLEVEEMMPKLKNEYQQYELEHKECEAKGKEKIGVYVNLIESQKKSLFQLHNKVAQDSEEVDGFASDSVNLNSKCEKLEEKMKNFDLDNKEKYLMYVQEMTSALNSIQEIFSDSQKFF